MSVGLAMIAKNGEGTMERVLDLFQPYVDEVSIVLGGKSADRTAEIAAKYADVLSEFEGEFMFGPARQQAYDQLSTDWAITVDTDEIWSGIERLRPIINSAPADVASIRMVIVSEAFQHEWTQSRAHRRALGQWHGGIHEVWRPYNNEMKSLFTNELRISQPAKDDQGRREQNINIAYHWLEEHPEDLRTIVHLAQDLAAQGRYQETLQVAERFFTMPEAQDDPDQYFAARFNQAAVEIDLEAEEALEHMLDGLTMADYGPGWTVLAEILQRRAMAAREPGPLAKLALFCAEQAIAAGKTRSARGYSRRLTTTIPFILKAHALESLGREREAVRALDMGCMLDPSNKEAEDYRLTLCQKLGMVP